MGYLVYTAEFKMAMVEEFLNGNYSTYRFAKTEKDASISGRLYTIIQTAKANGLIVDKYIEYVLDNIAKAPIEDLLPWAEKLPNELSIKQFIK